MITSIMLARQITTPRPSPTNLTPLLRYSCGLLPLFLRVPSFVFNGLQPLLPKTGGWGTSRSSSSTFAPRCSTFVSPLFSWSYELLFPQPLSFHNHLRCPPGVPPRGANSQIRNIISALHVLCACPPQAALSVIVIFFGFSEPFKRSDIPTFNPFSARMLVTP